MTNRGIPYELAFKLLLSEHRFDLENCPEAWLLMKHLTSIAIATAVGCSVATAALGASATTNVTVNSAVGARASLVFGTTTIGFPDADPGTVSSIPATQNAVSVTASVRSGSSSVSTLQVQAAGDLTSGSDTIPISNVTWTATGAGFVPGTMNKATAQTAGSWTGPGQRSGSFSYFMANSWNYATGNYSVTVTYTLSAP